MELPRWALTATAAVLQKVSSLPDQLGQRGPASWQPQRSVPCASFPISRQGIERAQLLGVQATREVYLDGISLSAQTNRLSIAGVTYSVQDSREWDGFTVALVKEV
ncbi:hypothetical protein ACFFLM_19150 [Deinococcus oregonensis]|uniref:Uncharacterized protein n=1 Tax=Deinococcus oregonensis TaxID=1805970 RepID=A0ABV6B2T4_9DEIO